MPDEVIHVEVTRIGEPRRPSLLRRAILVIVLMAAIGFVVWLFKPLVLVLIVAALLAAASTAKVQRRRSMWGARSGRSTEPVGVSTYVRFLAAWFFGILAVLPFALLVAVGAIIVVAIVVVVAILALVANLFGVE